MEKFLFALALILSSNVALADSAIIYRCKTYVEIYDEESRTNPRYEPNKHNGTEAWSRSLNSAIKRSFKNSNLTGTCDVDTHVHGELPYQGSWDVIDRDEKYLIANCGYSCEEDTL